MKSFSRDTPSFATFSAISAALHQKVVTKIPVIVSGDMILSRGNPGHFRRNNFAIVVFFSVFSPYFSPAVVRCPTAQQEDVLLGRVIERGAVESAPARDQ